MADAMYAPVCSRFVTYDIEMNEILAKYCTSVLELPDMVEWITAAESESEPEHIDELDAEF